MALNFTPLGGSLDIIDKDHIFGSLICCEGTIISAGFQDIAEDILNMDVREDDTWVCSFPKSGTTWTQELVWCVANGLDSQDANISQLLRFPYLELEQGFRRRPPGYFEKGELEFEPRIFTHSLDFVKRMKSPRFIKTHLPFHLLPWKLQRGEVKSKIVYVTRNPMDTCISFFHHSRLLRNFTGSLDDFATMFISDAVIYAPFWPHRFSYLKKKNTCNILSLEFEDMKKDLPTAIKKTAAFLNKELTVQDVDKLCDRLSFPNMKNNPATNREDYVRTIKKLRSIVVCEGEGSFMREGTVDQWKSVFSDEWVQRFRTWTETNTRGTELCKSLDNYGLK